MTSWGGLSATPETQKYKLEQAMMGRKLIATDPTGSMYLWIFDDMIFVDTYLAGPFTLSTYKHWRKVRDELESQFKEKGIYEYFALVDTFEKFRWCEFLGFKAAEVTINDKIEVMVRNGY